jgi:hypothetical protein
LFPSDSEGIQMTCYFIGRPHSFQDNAGSYVALLTLCFGAEGAATVDEIGLALSERGSAEVNTGWG